MAGISRDEILTRYRHLRAISVRHDNGALEFLSKSALLEHARHLGLTVGKTLVAESMDELTLAIDRRFTPPGRDTRGRSTATPGRRRPSRARTSSRCWRRCARRASRSGGWSAGTRWPG